MQEGLISFIIPNRGGMYLPEVAANINEVYAEYDKEIIIVEQCDGEAFKKGQLFNIAFTKCNGEYVALQDNDIIHFRKIDLFGVLKENDMQPFLGFTCISQIPSPEVPYKITKTNPCPYGYGAFLFGLLDTFVSVNGFSNLYIAWGGEDNEIAMRIREKQPNRKGDIFRVKQDLGHITHPIRGRNGDASLERNRRILRTRNKRDINLDGITQTVYTLVSDETVDGVRTIKVKDITVPDGFPYKNLL